MVQRYDYTALDNKPSADATLSVSGGFADAAAVGNAIATIRNGGSGLSDEAKQALLTLLEKVAYIDDQGQTYLDALETALYPPASLVSIRAVFNQGTAVIYDTDTLDSLKQYLTVTAVYDNQTSAVITAYALSGTLTEGTSTITVMYGGKTVTFNVTVTHYERILLHAWDFTQSLNDTVGSVTAVKGSNVTMDENGLHFTAAKTKQRLTMPGVLESDITIEVDVSGAEDLLETAKNRRFIMFDDINGLIYRSTGSWQWYIGAWKTPSSPVTDVNIFSGKTAVIKIDSNNMPTAYCDGAVIADNGVSVESYNGLQIGSGDFTFYNMTISAIRIYRGVE